LGESTSVSAARRAQELYELGFAKAAIDVLEVALQDDALEGRLWGLRAVLLAREGRHDEAFANVQEAMTLAPLGHEELLILAARYARGGTQDVCRRHLLATARRSGVSASLFQRRRVVVISHAGETYRLLLTRNNRLILQK
jgi:hemin uptake protein HemP